MRKPRSGSSGAELAERALAEAIALFQAKDDEMGAARTMIGRGQALMALGAALGEAQLLEAAELLECLGSKR